MPSLSGRCRPSAKPFPTIASIAAARAVATAARDPVQAPEPHAEPQAQEDAVSPTVRRAPDLVDSSEPSTDSRPPAEFHGWRLRRVQPEWNGIPMFGTLQRSQPPSENRTASTPVASQADVAAFVEEHKSTEKTDLDTIKYCMPSQSRSRARSRSALRTDAPIPPMPSVAHCTRTDAPTLRRIPTDRAAGGLDQVEEGCGHSTHKIMSKNKRDVQIAGPRRSPSRVVEVLSPYNWSGEYELISPRQVSKKVSKDIGTKTPVPIPTVRPKYIVYFQQ